MNRRAFLSLLGTAAVAASLPLPDFSELVYDPAFVRAARCGPDAFGLRDATRIVLGRFVESLPPGARHAEHRPKGFRIGEAVPVLAGSRRVAVTLAHQESVAFDLSAGHVYPRESLAAAGEVLAHRAKHVGLNVFGSLPHPPVGTVDETYVLTGDGVSVRGVLFYEQFSDQMRMHFSVLGGTLA